MANTWALAVAGLALMALTSALEAALLLRSRETINHRANFWSVVGLRWVGFKLVGLVFWVGLRNQASWLFLVFTWSVFTPLVLSWGLGVMFIRRTRDS
jgi:hypothetical protein